MSNKSSNSNFQLNLLLQQQSITEIKYETIRLEEFHTISEEQNTEYEDEDINREEKNNLSLTLTKWHIEENTNFQQLKTLWKQYRSIEALLEKIYNYLISLKITIKAGTDLNNFITSSVQENNDFDPEKITIQNTETTNNSWEVFENCKKDYDLVTKNFKILLEIIDFSSHEVNQLKKQYDDVFFKYQQARSEIEKTLPTRLEEMKTLLASCLQDVGGQIDGFLTQTSDLRDVLKNMENKL